MRSNENEGEIKIKDMKSSNTLTLILSEEGKVYKIEHHNTARLAIKGPLPRLDNVT